MAASASFSRTTIAIMVGTEVTQVTPKAPIAPMNFLASNCGISTRLAWAASANLAEISAFM